MNIHITEDEFNRIKQNALLKIVVGSQLYKLHNDQSDTDELYITSNLDQNLHSIVQLHHQYQFKADNTDYLFCSLQSFVKNLLFGDSTINFEAIFSDEIKNHKDLSFLYHFRKNFYNYNLIRSYLGLCRRDLKVFKKEKNNKRLFHAVRGLLTAKTLMDNKEYTNNFEDLDSEIASQLVKIKNNRFHTEELQEIFHRTITDVDNLRNELNHRLDNKKIQKVMDIEKLKELDQWLIEYSMRTQKNGLFINDQYYSAVQEEIKYENN